MILAGDIGGTKTVLALFEKSGQGLRLLRDATFPSQNYSSFEDILSQFLKEEKKLSIQAGCFGVAGPVVDGACQATNLPWFLDEKKLQGAIRAPRVKLLNDLQAMAYGMIFLKPEELRSLNPKASARRSGSIAVIAAGTGLGEAFLYWDGGQYHPVPSEGGHTDFAPRTEMEIELLCYLQKMVGGRVSYERLVSGPGFFNIYKFLRDTGKSPEPPWLAEKLKKGSDPSATITQVGLTEKDPLCLATLELFCSIYGAEAGNLALKYLSFGGVFLGGGIAPKVLPVLENGGFLQSFTDKGRLSNLLNDMPVNVVMNPRAPLIGAAQYALQH